MSFIPSITNKNKFLKLNRKFISINSFKFTTYDPTNTNTNVNNKKNYNLQKNEKSTQNILMKLNKNKLAILYGISALGFFFQGYTPISMLAIGMSISQIYQSNQKLEIEAHNYFDEEFIKARNNKVLYAVEMIKKYIFKHPELKKYFPENSSQLHCTTYVAFNQSAIGTSYEHEDKLSHKRWEISSEIVNEELNSHGVFQAIILFHTPTHFVIEYLRVDMDLPIGRRTTVIDGRRDMKDWVEDMPDDKINKRMYPKFRPGEKIKY